MSYSGNYNYNYTHSFIENNFSNLNIKVIRRKKDAQFSENCRSIEMKNAGNYKYNYAHSFSEKDFKNLVI